MSVLSFVFDDRETVSMKMDIQAGAYPHVPPVDEQTLALAVKLSPHIQNVPDAKDWAPNTKTTIECKERTFDSQRIAVTLDQLRSDDGIACEKVSRDCILQRRTLHLDESLLRLAYQPSIKGVSVESCIYLDHLWNIRSADHLIQTSRLSKPQQPRVYDSGGAILSEIPPVEFDEDGKIKKSVFTATKRAIPPPDPHEDSFVVVGTRTMNRFLRFKSKRQAHELILTLSYLRYLAIQRTKGVARLRDLWVATDDSALGSVMKPNVYSLLDSQLGTRPMTDLRRRVEETFSISEHNFFQQFSGNMARGDGEIGYKMFCDLIMRLLINRELAVLYNFLATGQTQALNWSIQHEPKVTKQSLSGESFEDFLKKNQKRFLFGQESAPQLKVAGTPGVKNSVDAIVHYRAYWKHQKLDAAASSIVSRTMSLSKRNKLAEIDFPSFWGALTDPEVNGWTNTDLEIDENMPLKSYVINASHNTYITGLQTNAFCDVDGYAIALHAGARLIELDVWEGKDVHFAAGSLKLKGPEVTIDRVLRAIKETAFSLSDFPVILAIENFIKNDQAQKELAEEIRQVLSDPLNGVDLVTIVNGSVTLDGKSVNLSDAKLSSLKRRFIVMMKPTIRLATTLDNGLEETSEYSETRGAIALAIYGDKVRAQHEDEVSADPSKKTIGSTLSETLGISKLAPILKQTTEAYRKQSAWSNEAFLSLACITKICSSTGPDASPSTVGILPVRCITEGVVEFSTTELIKKQVTASAARFTCVCPSMGRSDSSNLDPIKAWACGAHVSSMNFQTWDLPMHINAAKFKAYGRKGYVPKQLYYRSPEFSQPSEIHRLKIEVLCGQQFPVPIVSTGAFTANTRPFVRLSLHDGSHPIRYQKEGIANSKLINSGINDSHNPTVFGFGAADVANLVDSQDPEEEEVAAAGEAMTALCDVIGTKLERVQKLDSELDRSANVASSSSTSASGVLLPPAPTLAKCEIEVLEEERDEIIVELKDLSKALLSYNVTFDEKTRVFSHDRAVVRGITGWESIRTSVKEIAQERARSSIQEELSFHVAFNPSNCLTPYFGGRSAVLETTKVEEAFLVIEIVHLDKSKDETKITEAELLAADSVAVAATPLVALRGGYRCVQFRDASDGHMLPYTYLLCNFTEEK